MVSEQFDISAFNALASSTFPLHNVPNSHKEENLLVIHATIDRSKLIFIKVYDRYSGNDGYIELILPSAFMSVLNYNNLENFNNKYMFLHCTSGGRVNLEEI